MPRVEKMDMGDWWLVTDELPLNGERDLASASRTSRIPCVPLPSVALLAS